MLCGTNNQPELLGDDNEFELLKCQTTIRRTHIKHHNGWVLHRGAKPPTDVRFRDLMLNYENLKKVTQKIIDIKTSTMGWNKYQKADKTKTAQLVLYKSYYAKQFNVPIDNIRVEYFKHCM